MSVLAGLRVGVTGTSSGLGAFLCDALRGMPLKRPDLLSPGWPGSVPRFDLLIHCAFDARKAVPAADLPRFVTSNLTLVERLVAARPQRFVYVSSVEVYPADGRRHDETEDREAGPAVSLPGAFKLAAERMVLEQAARPLVLRCSSIVGPTARPNNVMRVLRGGERPALSLDATSRYNLVAMSQILALLEAAVAADVAGVLNVGSRDEATLGDIAAECGVSPAFGGAHYEVPLSDTGRARRLCGAMETSTLDVARAIGRALGAGGRR